MFKKNPDSQTKYLRPLSFETISLMYDAVSGFLAFYIAIYLLPSEVQLEGVSLFKLAFIYALTVLGVGLFLHTHREAWGKASVTFISRLIFKLLVVTALYYPLMHLMSQNKTLPWTIPVHTLLILGVLIGLPRFIQRVREHTGLPKVLGYERTSKLPVLVIGSDHAAHEFIERAQRSMPNYTLVGSISISSEVKISDILGLPVLGTLEKLEEVLETLMIEETPPKRLILIEQSLIPQQIKHILQVANIFQIPVLMNDYPRSENKPLSLRKLSLEDLIQYGSRVQDNYEMKGYIQGKRILITSACEPLMKELALNIAELDPSHIVLEDSFVMGLSELKTQLLILFPQIKVDCVDRFSKSYFWVDLLSTIKPDLIFYSGLSAHALEDKMATLKEVVRLSHFASPVIDLEVPKVIIISQAYSDKEDSFLNSVDKFMVEYAQFINCGQSHTRFVSIQLESNLLLQDQLLQSLESQQKRNSVIRIPVISNTCYFALKREITKHILDVVSGENENETAHQKAFVIDQVNPTFLAPLMEQAILASGLIPHIDVEFEQFDAPKIWQFNGGFHQGLQLKSISVTASFDWIADFLNAWGQEDYSAAYTIFQSCYAQPLYKVYAA